MDAIVGGTGFCTEDGDLVAAGSARSISSSMKWCPTMPLPQRPVWTLTHSCLKFGVIKHHSRGLGCSRQGAIDANQVSIYISSGYSGENSKLYKIGIPVMISGLAG